MTNKSDKREIVDSDCLEAFDHLYAYINGELKDPESVAMIEHHLDHCRSCFTRAQIERRINKRLQTTAKGTTPTSLQNRLNKLIDEFGNDD